MRCFDRRACRVALLVLSTTAPAAGAVIPDASEPALLLGPDGLGLIAYHDRTNGDLKVAHCVDAACSAVTTVTVDSNGDVGRKASMVMAPSGPVIAYEDTTNGALKLALCADPLCSSATTVAIASDLVGKNTAVALASDGRPLLAYVGSYRLKAAHCEDPTCSTRTISDLGVAHAGFAVGLAVAGDGRGMIVYAGVDALGFPVGGSLLHCADVACTAGSVVRGFSPAPGGAAREISGPALDYPTVRIGTDGLVRVAIAYSDSYMQNPSIKLLRCLNAGCDLENVGTIPAGFAPPAMALGTGDLPRLVMATNQPTAELHMARCLDQECASYQPQGCLAGLGRRPSLELGAGDVPLVAFERGETVEVMQPPVACSPYMEVQDTSLIERTPPTPAGRMQFFVGAAPAQTATVQVDYQTADGTAQAGTDYVPVSGTLTFAPGQPLFQWVEVTVVPDSLDEPDETLQLLLSAPVNVSLADATALGVIRDDDGPVVPEVSTSDCETGEGDAGTTGCVFSVALTIPTTVPVTVGYQTADGTATGGDYLAVSGILTFAPGTVGRTVSVSVVGDTAVELDERFFLHLASPVNATIGDGQGIGTIVDDDAPPLSQIELTHGSRLTADLAAAGPGADEDFYRLLQGPYSSWEIVVDEVSGDVAPGLELQLLAEDNSTIQMNSILVGTGSARSLRWEHRSAMREDRDHVRVRSASCTTDCGPEDTYRLRAYETTGVIPRFNNSGSQLTVLVLQNTTGASVSVNADFWDTAGVKRETVSLLLPPQGVAVVNTATLPALAGVSGSITVTHGAGYGRLVGKTVALEPATGFSFDSPMASKAR